MSKITNTLQFSATVTIRTEIHETREEDARRYVMPGWRVFVVRSEDGVESILSTSPFFPMYASEAAAAESSDQACAWANEQHASWTRVAEILAA